MNSQKTFSENNESNPEVILFNLRKENNRQILAIAKLQLQYADLLPTAYKFDITHMPKPQKIQQGFVLQPKPATNNTEELITYEKEVRRILQTTYRISYIDYTNLILFIATHDPNYSFQPQLANYLKFLTFKPEDPNKSKPTLLTDQRGLKIS